MHGLRRPVRLVSLVPEKRDEREVSLDLQNERVDLGGGDDHACSMGACANTTLTRRSWSDGLRQRAGCHDRVAGVGGEPIEVGAEHGRQLR